MPWHCIPYNFQQHVKQQERRITHLAKELKAAREEICKLKAGNVNSNFLEQENSGNWGGNSNSRAHKFSANDAGQIQLNNKFSTLATDTREVGQQTSVLLKHKSRELKSFTVKREKNKNKRKILLLGSSHCRDIGSMLQENLELNLIMSYFQTKCSSCKGC
jgi:hypothetical protein